LDNKKQENQHNATVNYIRRKSQEFLYDGDKIIETNPSLKKRYDFEKEPNWCHWGRRFIRVIISEDKTLDICL